MNSIAFQKNFQFVLDMPFMVNEVRRKKAYKGTFFLWNLYLLPFPPQLTSISGYQWFLLKQVGKSFKLKPTFFKAFILFDRMFLSKQILYLSVWFFILVLFKFKQNYQGTQRIIQFHENSLYKTIYAIESILQFSIHTNLIDSIKKSHYYLLIDHSNLTTTNNFE